MLNLEMRGEWNMEEGLHFKSLLVSNIYGLQALQYWMCVVCLCGPQLLCVYLLECELTIVSSVHQLCRTSELAMLGIALQAMSTASRLPVNFSPFQEDICSCKPVYVIIVSICEKLTPWQVSSEGKSLGFPLPFSCRTEGRAREENYRLWPSWY
jgi:hypothetical protein